MPAERFDFPNARGQNLAALLDRPAEEPRAYALFAHCFTCGKDIHAAKRIAEGLTALGIAVLRFDFTGLGSSEDEFANTTFSSNIADLVAAANELRRRAWAPAELHRADKLRVLAVTHGTRLTAAPELPTAVEQGLTDLVAPNFVGVFAPAGTPKPIIDQVAQANLALLADHDYRELLVSGTFEPHGDLNPEAYRRYVDNELARWSPIVRTLGLKID